MSQMPDSIYLHKDAKYNTLGWYHAEEENTILAEHDYDESVMEDYVEYTPVYRLEEAVRKSEKETIERAIAWLEENADKYIVDLTPTYPDAPANIIVGGMCWEHLKDYLQNE